MAFKEPKSNQLEETSVNIIAEGTRLEGNIVLQKISRVHGVLSGEITAAPGSTLILGETGVIEGNLQADTVMINGYVHGTIQGSTKVSISKTGRVIGNIQTPCIHMEAGAYFEGRCSTT